MEKRMSLPKLLQQTQSVFNAWIRERDRDKGCISCSSMKVEHASHYFSMGQHSSLRFNEMNVNGSCIRCNCFLHGNLINYRIGLINRYGEEKVLMLENSARINRVKKWSQFELEAITKQYKSK